MIKYVKNIKDFSKLFEKLSYENEKYWATYTAMMFKINNNEELEKLELFLLKYIRITDHIFEYSNKKILLILEETTLKWALNLNDILKKQLKKKNYNLNFYSSAIQWDFIEKESKLLKWLLKRLKIAEDEKTKKCIHSLSSIN